MLSRHYSISKYVKFPLNLITFSKVSVQEVVALGGHFAILCQEVDFYEAFFFIIDFQKKGKYFYTFNHFYSEVFK